MNIYSLPPKVCNARRFPAATTKREIPTMTAKSALTTDQIRALATWVCTLRDWQHPAVCRALWQLRHEPPALLASAATRAALDPGIRTPEGIGWRDRPHWRPDPAAAQQAADDAWAERAAQLRRNRAAELANRATPDQIRTIRERTPKP